MEFADRSCLWERGCAAGVDTLLPRMGKLRKPALTRRAFGMAATRFLGNKPCRIGNTVGIFADVSGRPIPELQDRRWSTYQPQMYLPFVACDVAVLNAAPRGSFAPSLALQVVGCGCARHMIRE